MTWGLPSGQGALGRDKGELWVYRDRGQWEGDPGFPRSGRPRAFRETACSVLQQEGCQEQPPAAPRTGLRPIKCHEGNGVPGCGKGSPNRPGAHGAGEDRPAPVPGERSSPAGPWEWPGPPAWGARPSLQNAGLKVRNGKGASPGADLPRHRRGQGQPRALGHMLVPRAQHRPGSHWSRALPAP